MDKNYNHQKYEEKIYKKWELANAFKPNKAKKRFSILLPPPNANAPLHYGHAMYTVEDILIRFYRMRGESTLWLPGADHAGFETQVVYEKYLEKNNQSRFDFDRETLYQNIWDFVQKNRRTMEDQLKKLGFSLDWSRKKFTLDNDIVKIVHRTFKKMYDKGLIYRDLRLVNYCVKHGTAFSDLEVEHQNKISKLYFVRYKIKNEKDSVTVATTRPETIFADSAVAVNPKDKRYKKYIGKIAINPLNGNQLPIIADKYVKIGFGTGALKVTPLHDENDFEIGQKHKLKKIQIIDYKGRLTKEAGKFEGQKAVLARDQIVDWIDKLGALEKIEEFSNTVSVCYKCQNILEPLPMEQWFIKVKDLAKPAIKAVLDKEIKIIPKRFEKIYFNWLKNIKDWNISRQIVWGIRIPAWKNKITGEWVVTNGTSPKGSDWIQDTDTFDTWFSSGQWPFAVFNKKDYKKYYPLDVMETGYDILFFWVIRMVMLGIFMTGKVPFKTIYLHGIVRDSKGAKMSKSKGNVVNPLDIIDKYGADALRMSLTTGTGAGNDQNYSEEKIRGYRNFANKIWNATRFVKSFKSNSSKESLILKKNVKKMVQIITKNLLEFKLNRAAECLYQNFWHNFCDDFIEKAKKGLIDSKELKYGLEIYLKLLHPFMPFITEACWKELGNDTLLIKESWPTINEWPKT